MSRSCAFRGGAAQGTQAPIVVSTRHRIRAFADVIHRIANFAMTVATVDDAGSRQALLARSGSLLRLQAGSPVIGAAVDSKRFTVMTAMINCIIANNLLQ